MQGTSWADRLELVGDDDRLVGFAGALPLRLLAERTGLSAAMRRAQFNPVYDRGQVLIDVALTQVLGGEAISDFQGLRHLAPVIGSRELTGVTVVDLDASIVFAASEKENAQPTYSC